MGQREVQVPHAQPLGGPQSGSPQREIGPAGRGAPHRHVLPGEVPGRDRKSTRLNSSHVAISYAVFCLKKKKNILKSALTTGIMTLLALSIFVKHTILPI